jgi:hypothetical protein
MAMVEELKNSNTKLDKIITLLEGGNLQVKVVQSDEGKGAPRGR